MKHFLFFWLFFPTLAGAQSDSLIKACKQRDTLLFPQYLYPFYEKWDAKKPMKIIQLGDSHVQMGYFPNGIKSSLTATGEKVSSSAFLFPYALTGGFNPSGFSVEVDTSSNWTGIKMVSSSLDHRFALTGHTLILTDLGNQTPYLDVNWSVPSKTLQLLVERTNEWMFMAATRKKRRKTTFVMEELSENLSVVTCTFKKPQTHAKLLICSPDVPENEWRIFGFRTVLPDTTIQFQSYGSSGGKYEDYVNRCDYCAEQLTVEQADLVILSLGTNDAHKEYIEADFHELVKTLVERVRAENQNVCILLTTQPDTYFKGKDPISDSIVHRVLAKIAVEYRCALWNFSEVMGGNGSIQTWYNEGLSNADLMHLNEKGYALQGQLLVEALQNAKNHR